jgi:hypothetical protein
VGLFGGTRGLFTGNSSAAVVLLLISACSLRRMEKTFADVV